MYLKNVYVRACLCLAIVLSVDLESVGAIYFYIVVIIASYLNFKLTVQLFEFRYNQVRWNEMNILILEY